MNPSAYTRRAWEAEFPALGEALIAGATAAGARLVCLDNLYGYGPIDGVRTEATPMAPTGPKGRVRAAWDARLRAAPGLRWVAGRAGDFFGPGAGEQSLFSETNLAKAKVLVVGDADAPHAFSHVPDVVEALVALGTAADDVEGRVFHLPIVQATPRALAGKPVRVVPAWVIRALSLFVPFFAELRETLYQWERPFLADDGAFRARFPEVGRGLGVVG
jgi:nucleoside-diphosphate-sugar epimerase